MHKQIPDFSYSNQRPASNPQAHDALKVLIFLDISPETSFPSIVVWGSCAKREISQAFCKQILHCLSTVLVMSGEKKSRYRSSLWDVWVEVFRNISSVQEVFFCEKVYSYITLAINTGNFKCPHTAFCNYWENQVNGAVKLCDTKAWWEAGKGDCFMTSESSREGRLLKNYSSWVFCFV